MDPIDEFTFKPLTEGLGFHKKKKDSSRDLDKAFKANSESLSLKSVVQSTKIKTHNSTLKSPLPKKEILPSSMTESPSKEVIDELVKSFKKTKISDVNNEVSTPQVIINPVRPQIDEEAFPISWMMSPFLIDAMLVMALILSALMIVLLVTKIDLLMMLVQNSSDIELWFTFPAIGLGMIFSYMSLTRILLGSSLGEMVFDIQLGTKEQQEQFSYNFLLMGRILLSILTGLIFIPLISLILRKDYLGQLSGIRLYRRKK